jgi:replicative DNA helicase
MAAPVTRIAEVKKGAPPQHIPYNLELEKALLASIIITQGGVMPFVRRKISREAFYSDQHGFVFSVMCDLYDQHQRVDYPLLYARLSATTYDPVAPLDWITPDVFSPHAVYYASELFDLSQRRRLIQAAAGAAQAGYTMPGDEALAETEALIADIAERQGRGEDGNIGAAIEQMQAEEEAAANADEHGGLLGYGTGIPCYDEWSDGLRKKHYHVIGGYTGTGKTRVAIVMALSAVRNGARVMFVTLEMPKAAIAQRMVSYLANVNTRKLLHHLTPDEQEAKESAVAELTVMPLTILEQNRNLLLIEAAMQQYKPDIVFLDYIQKLEGQGKSIYEQVTSNTGRLQTLAIRHNCCMVCLSQVSNATIAGGQPDVIGFKESGAIAADADCAIMLSRNKEDYPNILEFALRKNRHGSEGKEAYYMDMGTGRMRALTDAERRQWKSK